jgi:Fe-S-cluster-containing hydrogenase component 2
MNILVNEVACTGCGLCELVCSMSKEKESNPAKSRIHVERHMMEGTMIPRVCINCTAPPCVEVCPTGALRKDEVTGTVYLDYKVCTDCGDCVDACLVSALRLTPEGNLIKCDLCDGKPECVRWCPTGAIEFQDDHK